MNFEGKTKEIVTFLKDPQHKLCSNFHSLSDRTNVSNSNIFQKWQNTKGLQPEYMKSEGRIYEITTFFKRSSTYTMLKLVYTVPDCEAPAATDQSHQKFPNIQFEILSRLCFEIYLVYMYVVFSYVQLYIHSSQIFNERIR